MTIQDIAPGRPLATWGAGSGYLDAEGHAFIWVGFKDQDSDIRLFESIRGGLLFEGIYLGNYRILRLSPVNTI